MTRTKKRVAILISGRGSNMKNLVLASSTKEFPAEVVLILSNTKKAEGITWAEANQLPTITLDHNSYKDRVSFENDMQKTLERFKIDIICLAGFMRLLSPHFVQKWENKILNIHPSLLPSFKGLNTHQRVLDEGVKFTGCTVHIVEPAMDEGPILGQAVVPVLPNDTEDVLAARVLVAEHKLYPKILELFASQAMPEKDKKVIFSFTINTSEVWYSPPLNTQNTQK